MKLAIEIIGWAGALTILCAYALLSSGRLGGSSTTFQWMNVLGAGGFVINSGYNGAYPSAVLNVVWIAIGTYALLRRRSRTAADLAPQSGTIET